MTQGKHENETPTGCFCSQVYAPRKPERLPGIRIPRTRSTKYTIYNNINENSHYHQRAINPFRTAVPFLGQTSQIMSNLSPKRDCGSKGVNDHLLLSSGCLHVSSMYEVTPQNTPSVSATKLACILSCSLRNTTPHAVPTQM